MLGIAQRRGLGVEMAGQARAFPFERVRTQSPLVDKVGGIPLVLVTGPDGKSVRVFRSLLHEKEIELYRDHGSSTWQLVDGTGNTWNFEGCATAGPATGQCLERIGFLKDFWFDWRNYHPETTVYGR